LKFDINIVHTNMKITEFLRNSFLTIAAVFCISCNTEPTGQTGIVGIDDVFQFTLKESSVSFDEAEINVQHDGPEDATWYYFVTDDLKKNDAKLLSEKYAELLAAGKVTGLKKMSNLTVTVDGLDDETEYKFAVFAITEDCRLYENVPMATLTFKTAQNAYKLTRTDDWELNYTGRNKALNKETVEVTPKNENGLYAFSFVSKESIANFNRENPEGMDIEIDGKYMATVDGLEMYVLDQIATIQMSVLGENASFSIEDVTCKGSAIGESAWTYDRQISGDYYLVAYGFYSTGAHTQTYSVTEITIEEEEAEEAYNKWIGNWTITGKAEVKKGETTVTEDRTYNVVIEKVDNNFMYKIRGWECGEDVEQDIEEDIFQLKEDESIGFPGYYNNGNLQFREISITTIDAEGQQTMGMYGWYKYTDGKIYPRINENAPMAEAAPLKAGESSTKLNGLTTDGIKYLSCGYTIINMANGTFGTYNPPLLFPLTLTRVTE